MKRDASPFFEWAYALSTLCFGFGLYLDGWAHNHLESSLESFFTPWHGVFYAGYTLSALVMLAWVFSRKKGGSFIGAIPQGHGLSIVGLLLFAAGGIADMNWHLIFGIEADIEALLSPSHLLLAAGMMLMVTGGMRHHFATRTYGSRQSFIGAFPMIASMALIVMILTFMTQFLHYTQIAAFGSMPLNDVGAQARSLSSILLFSVMLTGTVSVALRQAGRLPFGALTFLMTTVVAAISMMQYGTECIPAALLAGLIGDLCMEFMRSSIARWRFLMFILPVSYYALMFLSLIYVRGTWWSIHMWTGAVVYGGFAGLLISTVTWPVTRD